MCLPSIWDTMTREERLLGAAEVRKHHRELFDAYVRESQAGVRNGPACQAFDAHTKEHNNFVSQRRQRLLAERRERIK